MKRFLITCLVCTLLLSMAACELDTSSPTSSLNNSSSTTKPSANSSTPSTSSHASTPSPVVPSFQEQTVVDNEYCLIKITGIENSKIWGYTLNVYLENKSADTTYMMSVTNASINGVQADPFFATEVAPGKKANKEISFSDSLFDGNDIGDYTDVYLEFRVYDSNDWAADPVAEPKVHIYPFGQEKATVYSRPAQTGDTILVDNAYVTAIVTGYRMDNIWGYTADLYLINKTDSAVMFSVNEVSVNGFMLDPFYAELVGAGMCCFSSIHWSNTAFEENGITDVELIEFLFKAYDENDWIGEHYYYNDVISLTP